jgi:uncharacterized protein (DUF3084 family)
MTLMHTCMHAGMMLRQGTMSNVEHQDKAHVHQDKAHVHHDKPHVHQDKAHVHQDKAHVHQDKAHMTRQAQRMRFVARSKRVTEQEAQAHAAAGGTVYAVPQLTGGGCGASVRS